jgi:hypothetical protein
VWRWLTEWQNDPVQARASLIPCSLVIIPAVAVLAAATYGIIQWLTKLFH